MFLTVLFFWGGVNETQPFGEETVYFYEKCILTLISLGCQKDDSFPFVPDSRRTEEYRQTESQRSTDAFPGPLNLSLISKQTEII